MSSAPRTVARCATFAVEGIDGCTARGATAAAEATCTSGSGSGVLAARARRIPVILDGFICTAATAPLFAADPRLLDHCLVGHVSREPGHARLLEAMGKAPILALDMALGEGSGAAVAVQIVRSALAAHERMATFAEAAVAGAT